MSAQWSGGDVIIRSEVLGLQPAEVTMATAASGVWLEAPVVVVDDDPKQLVTYMAPDAPFTFPAGEWPTPDGRHPWHGRVGWQGHGCLMVQRPGDHYAVWHFWDGPDREFVCWYLNLQTAFVRNERGFGTQDLELDLVAFPTDRTSLKTKRCSTTGWPRVATRPSWSSGFDDTARHWSSAWKLKGRGGRHRGRRGTPIESDLDPRLPALTADEPSRHRLGARD